MSEEKPKPQPDLKYPASLIRETWLKELNKVGNRWRDYNGNSGPDDSQFQKIGEKGAT